MGSLSTAKRVVIKIGSALLVDRESGLRGDWLKALAEDVAMLKKNGTDVVLVSSGSIALGRGVLGLPNTACPPAPNGTRAPPTICPLRHALFVENKDTWRVNAKIMKKAFMSMEEPVRFVDPNNI